MTPKTQAQIDDELAKLRDLKPRIPQYNENLRQIDAEIAVLADQMPRGKIEQIYGDPDNLDNGLYYVATYAKDWLDGTEDEGAMSENWENIARPKTA